MFKSTIIADSKNNHGNRITTFMITFPRIILSEFNTHRMLSRNSASSRAIPFEKMLESVIKNPFIPIKWMKEHKGMQGYEYFEKEHEIEDRNVAWGISKDKACDMSEIMSKLNVSKQICNRLLEPFMWHTVIVTATEWGNFFALRANDQAEIHMQKIAYMMLEDYNKSEPKLLEDFEWHIPFINEIDYEYIGHNFTNIEEVELKISTARCARVSYTVVGEEKVYDYKKDIELHDKLLTSGHMSPFEHCAQSISKLHNKFSGNFKGFVQYRGMIEGDNKSDKRVIKK